jgi:nucleolin
VKNFQGNYTPKVFIQFSDQETATAVLNAFQDYNFEGTTIKMVYAKNRLPPRTSKMADFDA